MALTEWLLGAIVNCFLILILLIFVTLIGAFIIGIGGLAMELISKKIRERRWR